ncbi:MAG: bifunctional UDP-sugar hydrolase/5'-nucleotidase [Candidatus Freyrarchaeum guaymaensis]
MKKLKFAALLISAILVLGVAAPAMLASSVGSGPGMTLLAYNLGTQSSGFSQSKQGDLVNITILHTNDIHSHLLPWPLADYNATGAGVGGMARIATLVNQVRTEKAALGEPVLLFDAGDFLMGTPYQWSGENMGGSAELLLMSSLHLNYTAIAIGNHEFDYSDHGLSTILNNTNTTLGGNMPLLLCSNLNLTNDVYNLGAFIKPNATITVNGVKIGLFSVIGYNANSTMFFMGSYGILDPIETAKAQVNSFKNDSVDLIILLSHSGWKEDVALAQQVDGIDLIIGGHDHLLLEQPIVVDTPSGNTTIVDVKCYSEYLGILNMTVKANNNPGQGIGIRHYEARHINNTIDEEPNILAALAPYSAGINTLFAAYGLTWKYDDVIANTTFNITSTPGETPIGDLVADALKWQFHNSTSDTADFALVPSGIIRHGFYTASRNITVYDAVSVVPLGGIPYGGGSALGLPYFGWFMCNFSLYGYEIKRALEFTLYAGGDYFLQVSGLRLTYSPLRMPGSQIISIEQNTSNGFVPLNDTKLYQVVINLLGALIIPEVGEMYPMFKVVPKWRNGTPLPTDQEQYVQSVLTIDTQNLGGKPVPEWLALVNYLSDPSALNGTVDPAYKSAQGRITVWQLNPMSMFTLYGLGQFVVSQQSSSSLMLGGLAGILLIVIVAAAVFLTRKT